MSAYNEAIKRVLAEVNKFLGSTLKSESLSKNGQKEKSRITEVLQKLFADYPGLAPATGDEGSASSGKDLSIDESRNTTGSSQGSEEDNYSDNIPETTVKALNDSTKMGFLDRKQKDLLFSTWQKQYCVLHKNILYCFKKPSDKKQKGAFFVTGYEVVNAPQNVKDAAKKEASFELVGPGKKTYQFCADNKQDMEAWRDAIVAVSGELPQDDVDDVYEAFNDDAMTSAAPPPIAPDNRSEKIEEQEIMEADEIYEFLEPPPPMLESSAGSDPPPPPASPRPLPPIQPAASVIPPELPVRNTPLPPVPKISLPDIPQEKKKRTPSLLSMTHPPAEDFENMYLGVWACKATSANELSFERGDMVHIINRELDRDDWWIGELDGKIGLVPKTFMHPAYQLVP
ncbi:src kinase-associated phosphoprotein 2-A [Aplysia californica]|uniref:Src kinase-associated phosphoprotein 2-A n=1 Tax=Aplysia californica TaxID=6500 RepID=A0ABM0JRF1_APLCA|nr:src kinase-associated phosphoprotein 2-A [Aplysia californica]